MRDPFRWSISLGRWGIPTVRLHLFFLVFAAATFFLCWQDTGDTPRHMAGLTTLSLTLLVLSVLAHEWGHWLVAHWQGTAPDTLVIGPLGGVSDWRPSAEHRGGLFCLAAGPATNLLICSIVAAVLGWTTPHQSLLWLLNPLAPVWSEWETPLWQQVLQLVFWVNWLLLLANLLPAYPFDGGEILQATLRSVCPHWTDHRVSEVVFWVAATFSVILFAAAVVLLKRQDDVIFPTSFALLLLAVLVLVSARRDMLDRPGPTPSAASEAWPAVTPLATGHNRDWQPSVVADLPTTSEPERSPTGAALDEAWPSSFREPELDQEEIEADEERQVDRILSQLHTHGIESLSSAERELLERVSARYRSRLQRRG